MKDKSGVKDYLFFFGTVALIAVADQLSKLWVRIILLPGRSIPETGFLRLEYSQNTGAVFGLFQGNNTVLTIIAAIEAGFISTCFLIVHSRYTFFKNPLSIVSVALFLGGAVGNLIDRLHLGFVTDFIKVGPWPNFNIADSSEVIGIVLLAYALLRCTKMKITGR